MSAISLFRFTAGKAAELKSKQTDLEKKLQNLIEENLAPLFGVRLLATEYSTGPKHGGRIDTLGIDENDCPVILEYKRSTGENVTNQGLYYLDWLMDHQAEFEQLVRKKLGGQASDDVDWSEPRVICVASDFTKYDAHAVQQMGRNIELVRYKLFDGDLMLLELTNSPSDSPKKTGGSKPAGVGMVPTVVPPKKSASKDKPVAQWLTELSAPMRVRFDTIAGYAESLGDDVQRKDLALYIAFKRLQNFMSVVLQKDRLYLYLKIDAATVTFEPGFTRDMRTIGHWGTGDVEVLIASDDDVERAKPLILRAYTEGR